MSKIAIKGWGIISELGNNEEEILKNWNEERIVTGEALEFKHNLDLKKIRRMGRLAKMTTSVTENSLTMGNVSGGDHTGIIMNTDYGSINLNIEFGKILKTPELASPMDFANTVSNAALGHVALYFNLKGSSTLLMGSNVISYTMRQLEKYESESIITCGGDEYCEPIVNFAKEKFGENILGEGVAALLLENDTESEWGHIIGDAQAGLGFSPLYQDIRDVTNNYRNVMEKALSAANLKSDYIDVVFISSDKCTGIRTYEDAALEQVFSADIERKYIKDYLGESFGASAISSVIIASILIKNGLYKNVLVLGTEVSGTLEAFIVSK